MGRAARTLIVVGLGYALMVMGAPSALAAPTNDNFGSATSVGNLPYSDTGTTTEATTQAADPTDCIGASHSVWYSFTSTVDVTVAFDTFGSDFDTVLSAYSGSQGSLAQLACDDDTLSLQSKIKWQATAGTVYHVMLSGYGDGSGSFQLHAYAEPFFSIEVSVSDRGSIDETSGVPTIRGTVSCSLPGFVNNGGVRLHQRVGETNAHATFPSPSFECGPDPVPWEMTADSQSGPFVRGKSRLTDISWYGVTADFAEYDDQTSEPQTVRLRR